MTIYFPSVDTTILHVPKTGGTFVKRFAADHDIEHELIFAEKDYQSLENIAGSQHTNVSKGTTIAFARKPKDWYLSYWIFKSQTSKINYRNKLDEIWSGNYLEFISNVQEYFPEGFMSTILFDFFYRKCDYVYPIDKIRNVLADLFPMMDRGLIYGFPIVNKSNRDMVYIDLDWLEPSEEIIAEMESSFIERYEEWSD